tara:strand:- start:3531 stop:3875 length:345 start_codon:yes stop_codon:yes gene_type:complete
MTPRDEIFTEALEAASTYFQRPITRDMILERSKRREVCQPRQWIATYLCWRWPGRFSLPQLARILGFKDHTTIIHARRVTKRRYPDSIFFQFATHDQLVSLRALCPPTPELEAA